MADDNAPLHELAGRVPSFTALEWAESIVDRDWEVFWAQDQNQSLTSTRSSSMMIQKGSSTGPDNGANTNVIIEREHSGQEDSLKEEAVAGLPDAPMDEEDMDDDSAADHEEDWYACHVQSMTLHDDKNNCKVIRFKVLFVGDETIYTMELTPNVVRPCVRAWVRRSLALLREDRDKETASSMADGSIMDDGWVRALPPDTRRIQDSLILDSIRQQQTTCESDCSRPLQTIKNHAVKAEMDSPIPDRSARNQFQLYLVLLRQQIYLRSVLAPIERAEEEEEDQPTDKYVNHLVAFLEQAVQASLWYLQCDNLHIDLLGPLDASEKNPPRVSMDLLRERWKRGRATLLTWLTLDLSTKGIRPGNKRATSFTPSSSTSQRRTKRRKRQRKGLDFVHGDDNDDEENDNDGEWSLGAAKRLCGQIERAENRFASAFGVILRSYSLNIMSPVVKWRRRTKFCLGGSFVKPGFLSEDTSCEESGSDNDDDEETERYSESGELVGGKCSKEEKSRMVSYDDIETCLNQLHEEGVLKRLDLDEFVDLLKEKLKAIATFEAEAWGAVESFLVEDLERSSPLETSKDEILQTLKLLWQSSLSETSAVGNVNPLGQRSPALRRDVLANAIGVREWLLDLKRAEMVRERSAFVESLAARLSEISRLPLNEFSPKDSSVSILDIFSGRLKKLSDAAMGYASLSEQSGLALNGQATEGTADLLSVSGCQEVFRELQRSPVVSIAEELLAVRIDVLKWKNFAANVSITMKPDMSCLEEAWLMLEMILSGTSQTRSAMTSSMSSNPEVDGNVRSFAIDDLSGLCAESYRNASNLYAAASTWKNRAEAILTTLQMHGNTSAGRTIATPSRSPTMVDLKRIEDALYEYERIGVVMGDLAERLYEVREASQRWCAEVEEHLMRETVSFESCAALVLSLGSIRPKGVIVDPTRHVMDLLQELLRWYIALKTTINSSIVSTDHLVPFLVEGIELVEIFHQASKSSFQFTREHILDLVSSKTSLSKHSRTLSREKLDSSRFCRSMTTRMVDLRRDNEEGGPILSLVYTAWELVIKEMLERCSPPVLNCSQILSLVDAEQVFRTNPPLPVVCSLKECSEVLVFRELITSSREKESSARTLLLSSKGLLRDCLRRFSDLNGHIVLLKELHAEFKCRASGTGGLALDGGLEIQLEFDVKVFGWLIRALQYPIVNTDLQNNLAAGSACVDDAKIPWDVLVKLFESIPLVDAAGEFSYVLIRVRELHAAATAWQEEVSNYTSISLRGGRRRNQGSSGRGNSDEEEDDQVLQIDVSKVAALSEDPILRSVAMPREHAVRSMLTNTREFEIQLQALLGCDYEGENPDRAAYPHDGSLVGLDGNFILYRLTGSSMYLDLKKALASIARVADNVFAETPGKAAFDWICKAITWIDQLSRAVSMSVTASCSQCYRRLVVSSPEAEKLLTQGELILLDVPDDLRRTLSQHKIFVSNNRDGKLTVKSKKGGAHYAVGAAAIRWCPILFEALKSDLTMKHEWDARLERVSERFVIFVNSTKVKETLCDEDLLRYHEFKEDIAELLEEALELVVPPSALYVESARTLLRNLDSVLQAKSNIIVERKFAEIWFEAGDAIVEDRFQLLESLVNRRLLTTVSDINGNSVAEEDGPFRTAARMLFEKALCKAVESMEVCENHSIFQSFCRLKAWEMESALYEATQAELGEYHITAEYRDQARVLKRSLEDIRNVSLCARFLANDIDALKLVGMRPEELADPDTRKERANAEAVAKRGSLLTPEGWAREAGSFLNNKSKESISSSRSDMLPKRLEDATKETKRSEFVELLQGSKAVSNPIAPPSLAASIRPHMRSPDVPSGLVENTDGDVSFSLTVAEGKRRFRASFQAEGDVDPAVNGMLPGSLTEKGRLPAHEYVKFLSNKLAGDRWRISKLRMIVVGDGDAVEYKKFYKHYEGDKERIAMFSLDDGVKMFLVTPKFRKTFKHIAFESTSSYAVILTRSPEITF